MLCSIKFIHIFTWCELLDILWQNEVGRKFVCKVRNLGHLRLFNSSTEVKTFVWIMTYLLLPHTVIIFIYVCYEKICVHGMFFVGGGLQYDIVLQFTSCCAKMLWSLGILRLKVCQFITFPICVTHPAYFYLISQTILDEEWNMSMLMLVYLSFARIFLFSHFVIANRSR